jgi:hypothetical protein
MLVCDKCGTLVEAHELPFVTEAHGERHKNTVCTCGGEFVEATKCDICGKWFDNTELHGVCEVCMDEDETVGTALAIGEYSTEKVDGINGFIADVLSVEQINKILTKWVEENFTDHSKAVKDYLYADKMAYSEFLENKYRKG